MRYLKLIFILCLSSFSVLSETINLNEVESISFLLASAKGLGQSSFGHAYMLFNMKNGNENNFPAVEFYTETDGTISTYFRALGLGSADRKVSLSTFDKIVHANNMISNRTLFSYELNLDRPIVENIVNRINEIVNSGGKMGKYKFFTSNCASAVIDLFKEAGIPLDGWGQGIPIQVPNVLKKNGLVKKIKIYNSKDVRVKDLILKNKYLLDKIQSPFSQNYFEIFSSKENFWKVFGIVYLKEEASNDKLESLNQLEKRKLIKFLNSLTLFENAINRKMILNNHHHLKAHFISSVDVTQKVGIVTSMEKITNIESKGIDCQNEKCFILARAQSISQKSSIRSQIEIKIKIPNLEIIDNKLIYQGEFELGFLSAKNRIVSSSLTPVLHLTRIENKAFIDSGILIDLEQLKINSERIISNQTDINFYKNGMNGFAICAGMTDFQKGLIENTLFDPSRSRLSQTENLKLVQELLDGKIIIIPGFNSALDFTSSLDSNEFSNLILSYHNKHYGNIFSTIGKWFVQSKVDSNTMKIFQIWIKHGVSIPIVFGVENSGNKGHSILITNLQDKLDRWVISGYDSNLGWDVNLAYIRKTDLKLVTLNYGQGVFYWYGDQNFDKLLDQRVLMSGEFKDMIFMISKYSNKFSFSLSEILNLD